MAHRTLPMILFCWISRSASHFACASIIALNTIWSAKHYVTMHYSECIVYSFIMHLLVNFFWNLICPVTRANAQSLYQRSSISLYTICFLLTNASCMCCYWKKNVVIFPNRTMCNNFRWQLACHPALDCRENKGRV
jgi:hypothetical protein